MNVTVYVFPGRVFTDKPEELNLKLYSEVLAFFRERGIDAVKAYDTVSGKYIAPESVRADYVFYDEPYDIYPEGFAIRDTYKRARVCYVPYAFGLTNNETLLSIVIPEYAFRFIYAFFANSSVQTPYVEKLYDKIGHEYHNVLSLGFPRGCRQRIRSHRYIQRICTAAIYDDVFFAYRVAIPRQHFNFRNVFSI